MLLTDTQWERTDSATALARAPAADVAGGDALWRVGVPAAWRVGADPPQDKTAEQTARALKPATIDLTPRTVRDSVRPRPARPAGGRGS
jgi:hypothetical protein